MRIFYYILAIICPVAFAAVCVMKLWSGYGAFAIAAYAAIILALPFGSFLHELGHMLFGAIVKIKVRPHFSLFGSSSCNIIPKTDKNLRFRVFFTAIGGLFVNAVFVVVGIVALYAPELPLWLCVFLPASLYLFLLNAAPVEFYGGKTDGLVCSEILENDDEAKVMLAVLKVQAQVTCGKAIEEVDEKLLFDLPQIREDEESFIALTELRYEFYKARGDEEKAAFYLSRFEQLKKDYL